MTVAAAFLAEADAAASALNGTLNSSYELPSGFQSPPGHENGNLKKRDTSFWMETVALQFPGSYPLDPSQGANYAVWRNVKSYGAIGDGLADDTAAINRAMSDGGRCGSNCNATSAKGAVIYFPPGNLFFSDVGIYKN